MIPIKWGDIFAKLYRLDMVLLYYIVFAFFILSSGFIFGPNAGMFKDMMFVYAITYLLFTKAAVNISGGLVLETLPVNIIFTLGVLLVFSFLPIPQLDLPVGYMQFSSPLLAFMWYVVIVGFPETIVFAYVLAERLGALPASILFGIVHSATIMALNPGLTWMSFAMVGVMLKLTILNLLFVILYRYTKSVYKVALIHGCIDLAKLGVLSMAIGGVLL